MIKSKTLVNTCPKCGLLKVKAFNKEGEKFKETLTKEKVVCRCK